MKKHDKPIESAKHEASESPAIEAMEKKTGKELGTGMKLKGGKPKTAKATQTAKPPVKKAGKVGPKIKSVAGIIAHRKAKFGV